MSDDKKILLMNSDSYLYSLEEVKTLFRMNRNKFVDQYIKTQKIKMTLLEDGRAMIRHEEIKSYLNNQQRIMARN